MQTISDSDFRLIAEKLPIILRAVRCNPDNHVVANAHRRLKKLSAKFNKRLTNPKIQNQNGTEI